MGLGLFNRKRDTAGPHVTEVDGVNGRYSTYFPRLFAFVRSCVGGDLPAQDITVEAFATAFREAGNSDEDRFCTVLFRTARRLCRPALKENHSGDGDGLTPQERDVLSLVFDAGLTRDKISRLFRIREATVGAVLINGLRKLKKQTSPAAVAAYLKMA